MTVPEMSIRTMMLTRSSINEYPCSRFMPVTACVCSVTKSSIGVEFGHPRADRRLRDAAHVANRVFDDGGYCDDLERGRDVPGVPAAVIEPAIWLGAAGGRQKRPVDVEIVGVQVHRRGGIRTAASREARATAISGRKHARVRRRVAKRDCQQLFQLVLCVFGCAGRQV